MSCSSCIGTGAVCVTRGDDATLTINFPDDVDLTGATVLFTAKRKPDNDPTDSRAVLRVTAVPGPDAHTMLVPLTSEETLAVPEGDYVWDLRVVSAAGESMHTRISSLCVHDPVTNRSAP